MWAERAQIVEPLRKLHNVHSTFGRVPGSVPELPSDRLDAASPLEMVAGGEEKTFNLKTQNVIIGNIMMMCATRTR